MILAVTVANVFVSPTGLSPAAIDVVVADMADRAGSGS
jgi:phenylpyruvate tautomerase PptA (4-oxalocrotonate tautomerase family)